MKTLTIALCLLLVVVPVSAQQNPALRTPNFHVPYGVRDVPLEAVEAESSSAEMTTVDPGQGPRSPMPRRYPVHRGTHRRSRPVYGPYPLPRISTVGVVVGVAVAFALVAALVGGDR